MGKKTDKKKAVRASDLIEEALKAVERREAEAEGRLPPDDDETEQDTMPVIEAEERDEEESGVESKGPPSPVGKIDPKQYVEKEVYLRMAADFENYRRRAAKERFELERSGREKILRGFLDILDNLERGLLQVKNETGPIADGMRMIVSQAEAWLKSEGLERVASVGKAFDPSIHDAVSQIESPDVPAGIVVEEIRRGYQWPSKLLRPASVVVSKGPAVMAPNDLKEQEK